MADLENSVSENDARGMVRLVAAVAGLRGDHTVSGYVKDVYSDFKVQSHAELMRRFTRGD